MNKSIRLLRDGFIIFIIYACLGWINEIIYFYIKKGIFINRGLLQGPYLPIYGFGAVLLWLALRRFAKRKIMLGKVNITPIIVFLIIFVVATLLEYISHYILDTVFNTTLWNYNKDFLNINGRVCLGASIGFAIEGVVAIYFIQPLIDKLLNIKQQSFLNITAIVLLMIVLVDFIIRIIS